MTTQAFSQKDKLLRNALRGNGIFSLLSGAIMVVGAGALANIMGVPSAVAFIVIGVGLLLHAVNLFYNAGKNTIKMNFGWFAIIADVAWVLGSAVILLTDAFSLSTTGKWIVLMVADVVLLFAIVQYLGLRKMTN